MVPHLTDTVYIHIQIEHVNWELVVPQIPMVGDQLF